MCDNIHKEEDLYYTSLCSKYFFNSVFKLSVKVGKFNTIVN